MPKLESFIDPERWLDLLKRINGPRRRKSLLSPQGLAYAGLNRRLLAAALDAGLIGLLLTPFNNLLISYAYTDVHWDMAAWKEAATGGPEAWRAELQVIQDSGLLRALARLSQIQFTVLAVYSYGFWRTIGATPGKWLLRMQVVDAASGNKISDLQAMLRLVGYILAGLPLGVGFFAMDWNGMRQGWHDKLAHTAVVILPWRRAA